MKFPRLLLFLLTGVLSVSLSAVAADPNVVSRGSLANARSVFETEKKGHVAFMGGSITEMEGYRPMVSEFLQKRFPETQFTFTAAGISSTCSTTGAFRLQEDVLSKGRVDLFFVEFAVNDDQDAHHTREECIRGMEGIVRHLRAANPNVDVVLTFFLNENSMAAYRKGAVPLPVAAHTEVAEHYGISTINLARAVTSRIDAGEFDWKKFGGVHPAPFGNRIAADMVAELLQSHWSGPLEVGRGLRAHSEPAVPLDGKNYGKGRFLKPDELRMGVGWSVGIPDWAALKGGKRARFNSLPLVQASQPGAELQVAFEGTAIGAFVLAGPDAGMLEAIIDGAAPVKVNLLHGFSAGLHYPRTVMFADTLAEGKHILKLRLLEERDPKSSGTAARVLHFVVNDGR